MSSAEPAAKEALPPARPSGDILFRMLCRASGLIVLCIALLLVSVLALQSWPALKQAGELKIFTSANWNPGKGSYGALGFIYGTVVTSIIAMIIAVPLGVGSAAYLSELAPVRVRQVCSFLLELLAAIPSVVYGFWAKAFLAQIVVLPLMLFLGLPDVREGLGGQSLLSAGMVLAIMILPYITAVSFDVCRAVPRNQREGALALGATKWYTISRIVLPAARAGIIAGCFLALGRALGETMAVTMVVGNSETLNFWPSAPGDTIPSVIAKMLHETSSQGPERSVLIALGFVLMAISLIMNVSARMLVHWVSRPRIKVAREMISIQHVEQAPPAQTIEEVHSAQRNARITDRIMRALLMVCQLVTIVPLFLILGFVAYRGAGAVNWNFFLQLPPPIDSPGGLGQAVLGSIMLVSMASVWAIPLSIMAAIFLTEQRRSWLGTPVRFVADTLGGVPSIVVGIFAYAMFVYPFWLPDARWGFSAWSGSFALGVMMLPVTIRSAEEALKLVPGGLREASYALGATQWQTVSQVLVPAAFPAIITGILLAVGRVAGETAPLLLTSRGSNFWPHDPSASTASLPFFINEFSKQIGQDEFERLGWAAAFVLLMAILILNLSTRLIAGKRVHAV